MLIIKAIIQLLNISLDNQLRIDFSYDNSILFLQIYELNTKM